MSSQAHLSNAYGLEVSDLIFQPTSPVRFSRFRNKNKRLSWDVTPLKPMNKNVPDNETTEIQNVADEIQIMCNDDVKLEGTGSLEKEWSTTNSSCEPLSGVTIDSTETVSETLPKQLDDSTVLSSDRLISNQPSSDPAESHQFQLGDMLWAKVGNHPWWPCMCFYCPDNVTFRRKKCRGSLFYHVQFFGPQVERAWVLQSNLLVFKGYDDFQQQAKDLLEKATNKKEIEAKFSVPAKRKALWDASWKEAEEALAMDIEQRKLAFGRVYEFEDRREKFRLLKDVLELAKESENLSDDESDSSLGSSLLEKSSSIVSLKKRSTSQKPKSNLIDDTIECILRRAKRNRLKINFTINYDEDMTDSPQPKKKKDIEEKKAQSYTFEFQRLKQAHHQRKISVCYICEQAEISADNSSSVSAPCEGASDMNQTICSDNPIVPCAGRCGALVHAECGYKVDPSEIQPPLVSEGKVGKGLTKRRSVASDLKDGDAVLCSDTGDTARATTDDKNEVNKTTDVSDPIPSVLVKCFDCHNNIRRCLVCRKIDTENSLVRCHVMHCRRVYHQSCVTGPSCSSFIKLQNNFLMCPAHTCHSCVLENPGSVRPSLRYSRCIYCPAAYHTKEACLPAGSTVLSNSYIVCPKHGKPVPASKMTKKQFSDESSLTDVRHSTGVFIPPANPGLVINVTWCFICSKGGHIICCECCPASFHAECLKLDDVPERFVCENCENGRFARFGEILWCKIGRYRWWPCEALIHRNIPAKIRDLPHKRGQFVAHLFGTDEYHWVSQGRVFPFEEGDELDRDISDISSNDDSQEEKFTSPLNSPEGNEESAEEKLTLDKVFSTALQLAGKAVRLRSEKQSKLWSVKPDHFRMIKSNYPIGSVRILRSDLAELPQCDCGTQNDPYKDDPCGITSECMNRELLFECHPSLCRYSNKCRNQNFVLRNYPKQIVFKTDGRGWGLKAEEKIVKGQFVNEYVGDLIDEEEANMRLKWAHENSVSNYYMMKLDGQRIIDAGPRGNLSRFMNHSCLPNLYAQKWSVHGDLRVGLFALRDIEENEELTFNYNFMSLGQEKLSCKCGAPNCSGYLGLPPKSIDSGENAPASSSVSTPSTISASEVNSNSVKKKRGRKRLADSTPIESQLSKKQRISSLKLTKSDAVEESSQLETSESSTPVSSRTKKPSIKKNSITDYFMLSTPKTDTVVCTSQSDDVSEASTIPCKGRRSLMLDNTLEKDSVSSKDTDTIIKGFHDVSSILEVNGNLASTPIPPHRRRRARNISHNQATASNASTGTSATEDEPSRSQLQQKSPVNRIVTRRVSSSANSDRLSANFDTKPQPQTDRQSSHADTSPSDVFIPVAPSVSEPREDQNKTKTPLTNQTSSTQESENIPVKRPRGRPTKSKSICLPVNANHQAPNPSESSQTVLDNVIANVVKQYSPSELSAPKSKSRLSKSRLSTENGKLSLDKISPPLNGLSLDLESSTKSNKKKLSLKKSDHNKLVDSTSDHNNSLQNDEPKKNSESLNDSNEARGPLKLRLSLKKLNGVKTTDASSPGCSSSLLNGASSSRIKKKLLDTTEQSTARPSRKLSNKICSNSNSDKKVLSHEQYCYRCSDPVDSLQARCDKSNCPKSYHLSCLGLSKLPNGRWYCPWHHCDSCGRASQHLCSECSASFCEAHYHDNVFVTHDKKVICMAHDELLTAFLLSSD